jgi:hypothetical protein
MPTTVRQINFYFSTQNMKLEITGLQHSLQSKHTVLMDITAKNKTDKWL